MSLALRLLYPWRSEQNDRGLAPVVRALQWSSSRLLPCGNDTVLDNPPLFLRPALAFAHPGQLPLQTNGSKSVRRNGARRTSSNPGTIGVGGSPACCCNTSAEIRLSRHCLPVHWVLNSLLCVSSNKLPVHRSPGGNRPWYPNVPKSLTIIFTTFVTPRSSRTSSPSIDSASLAPL